MNKEGRGIITGIFSALPVRLYLIEQNEVLEKTYGQTDGIKQERFLLSIANNQ